MPKKLCQFDIAKVVENKGLMHVPEIECFIAKSSNDIKKLNRQAVKLFSKDSRRVPFPHNLHLFYTSVNNLIFFI